MCVSSNKGKHRLTNQANYFMVQPSFKNKQNPAPSLKCSSLPQGTHTISLFIHIPRWSKPDMAFSLRTVPSLLFQRALEIQGPWTTYPFPAFWELNYKVLPLLSATVSHPCLSTNPSAFTPLINEWSPILAVIKKDTSLFPQLAWNTATVSNQQIQYSQFNSAHHPGQQNALNSLSDQAQSWRTKDKRDAEKLVQAARFTFTFTVYSSAFP